MSMLRRHSGTVSGHWPGSVLWLAVFFFPCTWPPAAAAIEDLTELPLESLMELEVTTVGRQAQSLADIAASVYVISREDIRRSGAATIPDALRLAPGLEIAHLDSNKVAMAIRGFNSGSSSNKLLVMIDGRIVYSALVAGVFWEHQDVLLDDIDRIEVIRGPGGTLWGTNAVNGIINIITRAAADTRGGLVEGIVGTDPAGNHAAVRYGGQLGDASYRIYLKYLDLGESRTFADRHTGDGRQVVQGGGRIDWRPRAGDRVTLQGDIYDGTEGQAVAEQPVTFPFGGIVPSTGVFREDADIAGGNILLRWQHARPAGSEATLQVYYDRLGREGSVVPHTTDTVDVDFQYRFAATDQIGLLWGLGYRHVAYDFDNLPHLLLTPDSQGLDTFTGFIQGDYDIRENLSLTLGSKFQHNEITGFEYQPSVRLHWHPRQGHTLWGAVSRAVRTPALFDAFSRTDSLRIEGLPPFIPPTLFSLLGSSDLDAEELLAFEAGYRSQWRSDLSVDISAFYNEYDNLVNFEPDPVPVFEPPDLVFRFVADNRVGGETYGLEAVVEWRPLHRWRLVAGYAYLEMKLDAETGSLDMFTAPGIESSSPEQQFQLRSYLDLPGNLELDVSAFWVDRLAGDPQLFIAGVDDYLKLDVHLGWRPDDRVSLDLFLQNLLDDRRPEFPSNEFFGSEIPRSVHARLRLRW